jgi:hypothetical protein
MARRSKQRRFVDKGSQKITENVTEMQRSSNRDMTWCEIPFQVYGGV